MTKKIITYLSLLIFISGLYAQEFSSSVNKSIVDQYERFQVDFTFNASETNGVESFQPPVFNDFRVLSGPNQSTNFQMINGQVSYSITYSYIIVCDKTGDFNIGPSTIKYRGASYSTRPLQIKIVKGDPNKKKESADGEMSPEELAKSIFIVAKPDRQKVFKGEQVTVTYELYTRMNITNLQIGKLPSYEGFWAEELETVNNLNFKVGMHNGERYRIAPLKKVALFPTKSGELTVSPFELNMGVVVRKRKRAGDIFDEFFNDSFFGKTQTIEYTAKSNTVKINVNALPAAGVPKSFNGAVGKYSLDASLDKNNVKTNEAVTLKIKISGTGNIKLLNIPEVELPAGFEKYEPKTSESINSGSKRSGQKTVEYLIVPRIPGTKKIPAVEFSYFNPAENKYVTLSSPEFQITVEKGDNTFESAGSGFSKEDVRLLNEDIRFIKTSNFDFSRKGEFRLLQSWFWVSIISPAIILLALILIRNQREKVSGDVRLMKYKKAEKAARTRLKAAKAAIEKNDNSEFYNELSLALLGYLEDKLSLNKIDFTLEKVIEELTRLSVDKTLIEAVKNISEKCEFARFAPGSADAEANINLIEDTVKLIVKLDSSIKIKKQK